MNPVLEYNKTLLADLPLVDTVKAAALSPTTCNIPVFILKLPPPWNFSKAWTVSSVTTSECSEVVGRYLSNSAVCMLL